MKKLLSAIISFALIISFILAVNISVEAEEISGTTLEWKGLNSYVTYHGVDDADSSVSNFIKTLPQSGNGRSLKFTVYNTGKTIIYNLKFYFQENWSENVGTEPAPNVHVFPGGTREFTINIPDADYENLVFRMDFQTPATGTKLSITGIDTKILEKFNGSNGINTSAFTQAEVDSFKNGTYVPLEIPATPTPVPTPVPDMTDVIGTKFSMEKDYDGKNGAVYITNGADKGIFTEEDLIDDGETLEKTIVIYNTGKEPFNIKFKGEVLHTNKLTGKMSLSGPSDVPTNKIEPGEAMEITFICDAEFDINNLGIVEEYTYKDMFVRFDVLNEDGEAALSKDFEFVVTGLDNLKLLSYGFAGRVLPQRAYAADIEGIKLETDESESGDTEDTDDTDYDFEEIEGPILTKAPRTATPTEIPNNSNNDTDNNTNNDLTTIIIAVVAGVVVLGVAAIIIIKKKKQN